MALAERRFNRAIQAARRGDPAGFRFLWDTFAGPVSGFLRARGTPEVGEVVNDVFAAAFDTLYRFEGSEVEFRAWLFAIARNKRIDQLRRQARRPAGTPLDDGDPALVAAIEDAALQAVDDRELFGVLELLTGDQRNVIVLRFITDLSLEQTAIALDKPVGAVKALQHRALARLRKKFPDNPYPNLPGPPI